MKYKGFDLNYKLDVLKKLLSIVEEEKSREEVNSLLLDFRHTQEFPKSGDLFDHFDLLSRIPRYQLSITREGETSEPVLSSITISYPRASWFGVQNPVLNWSLNKIYKYGMNGNWKRINKRLIKRWGKPIKAASFVYWQRDNKTIVLFRGGEEENPRHWFIHLDFYKTSEFSNEVIYESVKKTQQPPLPIPQPS